MNDAARGGEAARRWQFGPAVLDERTLELSVKGEIVSLERKPLEVLLFLLNHAGEVVTKDELLEAVWPGRVLSDSALTSCIAKIREALGDEHQELIKTVHGYGYRLVADIKVETSSVPPPPRFGFKPGDHPPNRPQWNLVERLGAGGHGEVWLGRHEKTREPRVFKFALDAAALVSLKREITIYRLLHEALGDKASIVEIREWNLEQPPYFIEAEYSSGGSLATWAEKHGGLHAIPLEHRLDVVAQVADMLAAAHSVGVLHKDLKPSNVLVHATEPRPRIKLADFGSGGVLDPHRLEALGITRLGFTKTIAAPDSTSGTPIYLAPEVIAGQPFTIQADVYALGVMLYQMAVGDLHKTLAPGWEKDVPDELLREDIAASAAGSPDHRLADASLLAQRLRTLDRRRAQRDSDKAARLKAEKQQRAMDRFKARIWLLAGTTAIVTLGAMAGFRLWFEVADEYHSTLGMLNKAADQLESGGKPAEAEAMLRQLLKAQDEQIVLYPGMLRTRNQLGMVLMNRNRLAEAEVEFARARSDTQAARVFVLMDFVELITRALADVGEEVPGPGPRESHYARISSNYGECLRRAGKLDQARKVLEAAQPVLDKDRWNLHAEARRKNIERLRQLYRDLGLKAEEAALPPPLTP